MFITDSTPEAPRIAEPTPARKSSAERSASPGRKLGSSTRPSSPWASPPPMVAASTGAPWVRTLKSTPLIAR